MDLRNTFLHSKVARRIVLLFISCALLPVTLLAILSYYEVSSQLREQSQKELTQASRRQGMAVYERLEMLDSDLQVVSARVKEQHSFGGDRVLQEHFSGISLFTQEGRESDHWGDPVTLPALISAEQEYLSAGNPLLKLAPAPDGGIRVLLVRQAVGLGTNRLIVVGQPKSNYLYSPLSLSPDLNFCVLSAKRAALYCSDDTMQGAVLDSAAGLRFSGQYQWSDGSTLYDAAYWKLLIKPKFLQESWIIVVSKDHAAILAPMLRFRRIFPLVVLLSLWIVLLASMVQIRRTLVPLEKLQEATRKIGMRQFDSRVEVRSGDEFESLGTSLNQMAAQLGRQFHALRAVNEIDQAIFASLDREAIIDGVLQRMPRLFPGDAFGVCVFDETRVSGWVRFRTAQAGTVQTLVTKLGTTDWLQLQNNAESFAVNAGEMQPEYLQPLSAAGMQSFVVLPIRVDTSIQAALVCANQSPHVPPVEDSQEVRQVADQLAVAFSHVHLIHALEELHLGTLKALARAIDAKSEWTAGHSERVTNLALELGREMGLSQKDLRVMQMGGLLHDIGKIGTPPTILDKPDKLTTEEMQVMKDHVRCGVRILEPIRSFREALPIVAQHHEWFNGKGYPEGLAGGDISLYARIFAVADCYDALKSDRPYRKGMSKEQTLSMLKEKSGLQFDPDVIAALLRRMGDQESVQPSFAASMGGTR
jgi:putative nucleotidyltransferase with HDIG domain